MARDSILSTHVLDTAHGRPAAGVTVELHRLDPEPGEIGRAVTDADGRNAQPLLPPAAFREGRYELRFHLGAYFAASGLAVEPPYLDVVPVRVHLRADRGHYHVPLLCTPWGYTTYRGS